MCDEWHGKVLSIISEIWIVIAKYPKKREVGIDSAKIDCESFTNHFELWWIIPGLWPQVIAVSSAHWMKEGSAVI